MVSSLTPRPHPQSLGRSVNYLLTKLEKVNHIGPYPTRENILYQWCMWIKEIFKWINVLHEPVKNLIWSFVDNSDIWVLVPKQEKKKSTKTLAQLIYY